MTERSETSLLDDLREAYETYNAYTFLPDPPDHPLLKRIEAIGERTGLLLLRMPLVPVLLFRLRNALLRKRVPLLPYACELVSMAMWRVSIGRPVQIAHGLIIPHGDVVIDGAVRIGRECVINPWVTIGLNRRRGTVGLDPRGPTIGDRVFIGTGARILGAISVGNDVRIGANAVVIDDVPEGATVVGAPGRVVQTAPPAWEGELRILKEAQGRRTSDREES
jgi:serine O-acetyltransferase